MRSLFSVLLILFGSRAAQALTVSSTDIQAQLNAATLVAEVAIRSSESLSDPNYYASFRSDAEVTRVIASSDDGGWFPAAGDHLSIEGLGGEINDLGVFISGFPRPHTGRNYRVYLKRKADHTFNITGFEEGLVPLQTYRNYSRNRTDGSNGEGTGPFLYWDQSFIPIPYYISAPSFKGFQNFIPAIDASFRTWRDIADIRIEFLPYGCSSKSTNENDGLNTVILVTKDWTFDPVAIAITRNFYVAGTSPKAGLILDSDILLNAVNHEFTTSNELGKHDVQNIVTHEVGHFLGLGHEVSPVDPDSTMFAVASPNEVKKRTLHTDDLAGIHEAYLGVGTKFPGFASPSCVVAGANVGCAAVHDNSRGPVDLVWVTMFFALLLLGGRIFWERFRVI